MFAKTAFAFFASVATALNAFTSAVEQFNSTDSACCSDRDVGEPRLKKVLNLAFVYGTMLSSCGIRLRTVGSLRIC